MLKHLKAFSSFSVDDIEKAKEFYSETLGLEVEKIKEMGILTLKLQSDYQVMIYPKDNHIPATFTVLNLVVESVDETVSELNNKGIEFEQYDSEWIKTDERGISKSEEGPTMAWFKDPSGNILAVLEDDRIKKDN